MTVEEQGWVVESIAGVLTIEPRPELALGEDGRLTGSTGVNRIFGSYEALDETLTVSGLGTTRMAGSPEAMDQESRFVAALEGSHPFVLAEGRLEIGDAEAGLVLVVVEEASPAEAQL